MNYERKTFKFKGSPMMAEAFVQQNFKNGGLRTANLNASAG